MSGMTITQYFFPGQVKNSAFGGKEIYGHRNKGRAETALDDAYALKGVHQLVHRIQIRTGAKLTLNSKTAEASFCTPKSD